jgi:hypothetical protein
LGEGAVFRVVLPRQGAAAAGEHADQGPGPEREAAARAVSEGERADDLAPEETPA